MYGAGDDRPATLDDSARLVATRAGVAHALVAWFEIDLLDRSAAAADGGGGVGDADELVLSTAPDALATRPYRAAHWSPQIQLVHDPRGLPVAAEDAFTLRTTIDPGVPGGVSWLPEFSLEREDGRAARAAEPPWEFDM